MSPSKLDLDPGVVSACRQAAKRIAEDVFEQISGRTTVSVERSVTRLLGVDGADELEAPLPERARRPRRRARRARARRRLLARQRDAPDAGARPSRSPRP